MKKVLVVLVVFSIAVGLLAISGCGGGTKSPGAIKTDVGAPGTFLEWKVALPDKSVNVSFGQEPID
jgi:hypothetical protein